MSNENMTKDLNKCVHCGQYQQSFFERHKIYTAILVFALLAAFAFAIAFGFAIGRYKDKDASQSSETNASKEPVEEIEGKEFSIGEKAELKGITIEVTDIKKFKYEELDLFEDVQSHGFPGADTKGEEYVIVYVSIINNSDNEIPVSSNHFRMKNSNGQLQNEGVSVVFKSEIALPWGGLAQGGNVSGALAFKQPIGDDLQLIYENPRWDNGRIIINLQ